MNAYVFVLLFLCQLSSSQPLFSFSLHLKSSTHLSNVSLRITEKAMAPHSSTLGKSHGQRSLVGCSPWGRDESDTTEPLQFHFSFSCIREGNGNPVQCSCLENPEDGGAWWAAVYGVAQSRTRLKQFSSSLRIIHLKFFWNPSISIILRFYFYLDEIITCIILCFTAVCCFNIILPSLSYKILGVVTILGKSVTFSFCWIIWTDTSIGVSSWIVGWLE